MFWRDAELAALAGTAAAQKLTRGAGASAELCTVELPCQVSGRASMLPPCSCCYMLHVCNWRVRQAGYKGAVASADRLST